MPASLPQGARELLQRPVFAHLATLMKDGSPQNTPVWVDTDGQYVYVNTAEGRVKTRNIRRDGRVALSILDPEKPYQVVLQVRGRAVSITTEGADAHIDKLAKKYLGMDRYPYKGPGEVRLIIKIEPAVVSGPAAKV